MACSADSGPSGEWAGTVREFGRIAGIAVDGSGRIHILDRSAQVIRVFDADGEFMRTIGRGGSGPGELNGPSNVLIGQGDTILVPDMANQRVQRFLPDGSDAGSFPIPLDAGIPLGWHMRDDGRLVEELRTLPTGDAGGEGVVLRVRTVDGGLGETLVELPVGEAMVLSGGEQQMTVFAPEPRWAPLSGDRIVTGWNAEYRLEVRNRDGDLERVISRPFQRESFSDADQRALQGLFRDQFQGQPPPPAMERMLQSMRFADTYPAYAELSGGPEGTLWVRHILQVHALTPDDMGKFDARGVGAPLHDVFDDEGRFLGIVSTPPGFQPMLVHDERIYGVQPDTLGAPSVVRLRIVR